MYYCRSSRHVGDINMNRIRRAYEKGYLINGICLTTQLCKSK